MYLKSTKVSEGWPFIEAMCAIPSLKRWSTGKCAQAKQSGWTQGQWLKKSAEFLLHMLESAESNTELKGLQADSLVIEHIQVNKKPPKMWHRNYRTHGPINPYMSPTCTVRWSLLKKNNLVRGGCTEEKDTPEETEETKNYDLEINDTNK